MKSKYYTMLSIITIALSTPCCKKDNNPISADNGQPRLYGTVIDSQGHFVEGVGVHYIYSFTSSKLGKTQKPCPATQINFAVPKKCFVNLVVFRWFTRDTIEILVRDTLTSGNYSVSVHTNKYTNGLYIYRLTYDTTTVEKYMSLLTVDIASLVNTDPLCVTNADGQFTIPYGVMGFNVPLLHTSESGSTLGDTVYISHTVQLVLNKIGYGTIVQMLFIDTTKVMARTFKFE